MVVAGTGGNDAKRNIAERQGLQGKRDDAVAAAHHQRIGAALERIVEQPTGVIGVGADDALTSTPRCWKRAIARSAACGALPWPDIGLVSMVTRPISRLVTESACRG